MLTREQILGILDLKSQTVAVPEWGGDACVTVRSPTTTESADWEQELHEYRNDHGATPLDYKARLVVKCVINGDGKRLFRDEDASRLADMSAAPVNRLYRVIRRLGAMDEDDAEGLEKNSEPARNSNSS